MNVKPRTPQYQPRRGGRVACEVRDVDGKPVAGAEVTLWAADEGVLSLTGFETPDPLAFFSKLLRLDVTTGLTLERCSSEDPEERELSKTRATSSAASARAASARCGGISSAPRFGTRRCDAMRRARLSANFTAPDGLTRYRVMAVVQTKRDQFGHARIARSKSTSR